MLSKISGAFSGNSIMGHLFVLGSTTQKVCSLISLLKASIWSAERLKPSYRLPNVKQLSSLWVLAQVGKVHAQGTYFNAFPEGGSLGNAFDFTTTPNGQLWMQHGKLISRVGSDGKLEESWQGIAVDDSFLGGIDSTPDGAIVYCGFNKVVKWWPQNGTVDWALQLDWLTCYKVATNSVGEVFLTGETQQGTPLVKISPDGELLWGRAANFSADPHVTGGYDLAVTTSSNEITVAGIDVADEYNAVLIRWTQTGEIRWIVKPNPRINSSYNNRGIAATPEGAVVLATFTCPDLCAAFLGSWGPDGEWLWGSYLMPATEGDNSYFRDVAILDATVVAIGFYQDYNGGHLLLTQFNQSGTHLRTAVGSSSSEEGYAIAAGPGGGVNAAGTGSDATLLAQLTSELEMYSCSKIPLFDVDYANYTGESVYVDTSYVELSGAVSSFVVNPALTSRALQSICTQAPLTLTGIAKTTYQENNPPQPIDPQLEILALNVTTIAGATIQIAAGHHSPEDRLFVNSTSEISSFFNSTEGKLHLDGDAPVDSYQEILRNVTYDNGSDDPAVVARKVDITVRGGNATAVLRHTITIAPVNDAPTILKGRVAPMNYVGTGPASIDPNLTIADPDSRQMRNASIKIEEGYVFSGDVLSLSGNFTNITAGFDDLQGVLILSGSADEKIYRWALQNVTFKNSALKRSKLQRNVSFQINDGTLNSNRVFVLINVAAHSPSSPKVSSKQESSPSDPGLAIGLSLGLTIPAALIAGVAGYVLYRRRQMQKNDVELQAVPLRQELGTVIGGKYRLINKVNQREAAVITAQTGVRITFSTVGNKTKVTIGSGAYGKLRLAQDVEDPQKPYMGVKKIKGAEQIATSLEEGKIQKELSALPNIMPLRSSIETVGSKDEPVLYQFMPLAGFGDGVALQSALQFATLEEKRKVFAHVAKSLLIGLSGMHEAKVAHLDLKPSNIVFDQEGNLYIIDFGCAQKNDSGVDALIKSNGDSRYFSPSRLAYYRSKCQKADQNGLAVAESFSGVKADLWASALLLLELIYNKYPLPDTTFSDKIHMWDSATLDKLIAPLLNHEDYPSLAKLIAALLNADKSTDGINTKEFLQDSLFSNASYQFVDDDERKQLFKRLNGALNHHLDAQPKTVIIKNEGQEKDHTYENEKNVYVNA